jgi:hypothetical protein
MLYRYLKKVYPFLFMLLILPTIALGSAGMTQKGIYLTQNTAMSSKQVDYLIKNAKLVGINTFVIDMATPSKIYGVNIQKIKNAGIKYVARVVIFPDGGYPDQVKSLSYWQKRYQLVATAISYGADEIQLDYIRYNSKMPANKQNSRDVTAVIKWFKQQVAKHNIPMQVDVFGETSYKESVNIGQNIKLIGPEVDAVCPMTYPSHYEPFKKHATQPYQVVHHSLTKLKAQFANNDPDFKVYPYFELYNYRYPMSYNQKKSYIDAQLRAIEDAKMDGWFAWNPHNNYDILFDVLKTRHDSDFSRMN